MGRRRGRAAKLTGQVYAASIIQVGARFYRSVREYGYRFAYGITKGITKLMNMQKLYALAVALLIQEYGYRSAYGSHTESGKELQRSVRVGVERQELLLRRRKPVGASSRTCPLE
jgi:hypothetical protein